jgi:isopentenyl phosphate kinase
MPHYFFHLITADGTERDDEGINFPDLEEAKANAQSSLSEMASDDMAGGCATKFKGVEIADSQGNVVAKVNVNNSVS